MEFIKTELNYKEEDIAHKFFFFNVLKDGRLHLTFPQTPGFKIIPAADDPTTGVKIKDVLVSPDVSARVFLPPGASTSNKLPVLYYIHGGAFCMCSAFSIDYSGLLTRLVAESNVVAVSVEYRMFPTHSISACYEDSWVGLRWLASHADPSSISGESRNSDLGPIDPWITDYADLTRIFVAGDSAGGNISHNVLSRVGKIGLGRGAKVEGMILVHTYFGEDDKMWMYMCPENEGPKDPRMKPSPEDLAALGCDRVLVVVAELDTLKGAGVAYAEELKKSGWKGVVEFAENKERGHCYHLMDSNDPEAPAVTQMIKSFIHNNAVFIKSQV